MLAHFGLSPKSQAKKRLSLLVLSSIHIIQHFYILRRIFFIEFEIIFYRPFIEEVFQSVSDTLRYCKRKQHSTCLCVCILQPINEKK